MTRVRVVYAGRQVDTGELLDLRPVGPWDSVATIRSEVTGAPQTYVAAGVCQVETIEETRP